MPVDFTRRFTNPVPGLTRPPRPEWDYFHASERLTHPGVDLAARTDSLVESAHPAPAKVHRAGLLNTVAGYGVELVEAFAAAFYATRALHMPADGPTVSVGQTVAAGQTIGRVDTSGKGTNYPHVHFEIRWGATAPTPGRDLAGWGTPYDPLRFGILDTSAPRLTRVTVDLPVLRLRDSGAAVADLQALLALRGYPVPPPDGDFDVSTDLAVRAYQKAKGITVDGVVGYGTWTAILDH